MTSPCPNKAICGSCGWSHIPYDKQLQQKLSDINGSLALKELSLQCDRILPSPVTEHYRNRMDFVIDFEGRVGLREKGKWWRVIDDHQCFLGSPEITALFPLVRSWSQTADLSYYDRKAHTGLLRYAVVRSTSLGETMITIVTSKPADEAEEIMIRQALSDLAAVTQASTVIWSINHTINDLSVGETLETISGSGSIVEQVNGWQYRITPNAFFQTNSTAAKVLQDTVLAAVGTGRDLSLLDLYCGSGFFSVPLAAQGALVTGVELVPEAIIDATVNAQLNAVSIDFQAHASELFAWSVAPDVLLLDPPRSGMHDSMIKTILERRPPVIVYVSCNYKNFARELVMLQEAYKVVSMTAIDLFPHTPHVELVTRLERI